jgi:hypothetical protein
VAAPTHPDHVLPTWLALRQRLSSPAAQDPVVERGFHHEPICEFCDSTHRAESYVEEEGLATPFWTCADCGKPWTSRPTVLIRGDFAERSRVRGGRVFDVLATYGAALSRLTLWQRRLYLLLYLFEDVGGYGDVALAATRRWKRTERQWSEWKARTLIAESRDEIWIGLHGHRWSRVNGRRR